MVAFLSRLVLRSFHNCDPFFCSSRSDLRLSPRALWPADETARLTFGIGDEDMSLQRLCKFHQPQGIDFESAESPRRDRASPDIDRHRPKLASPALVRFARLHARIGIFRLAESPLLFSAHVAFFWQRVFDEILQFTGFARTGRPRGGTFSDRFHFTALHIFVSQPEWRTAASERGEAQTTRDLLGDVRIKVLNYPQAIFSQSDLVFVQLRILLGCEQQDHARPVAIEHIGN